ncbi:hypothetical protein JW905_00830 [bacterium]|nr:hypothetical protein [candidate division CSSED10-310 bacterium]
MMRFILLMIMGSLIASAVLADPTPQWVWEDPETRQVRYAAITPDGSTIVMGSDVRDNNIAVMAVFDSQSPWPFLRIEYPSDMGGVAVSDDGQLVACTTGPDLHVYQRDGEEILTYSDTRGNLFDVEFDATATHLVTTRYLDDARILGGEVYFFHIPSLSLLWSNRPGASVDPAINARLMDTEISDDGTRILTVMHPGLLGDPVHAALYQTDGSVPDIPVWTMEISPAWNVHGSIAGDGDRFAVVTAVYAHKFDMAPPAGGVKPSLWTRVCGGYYTYSPTVAISADGDIVAHFGSYCDLAGDITPGSVEIFQGDEGTLLWETETGFHLPSGAVSADGGRVVYSAYYCDPDLESTTHLYDVGAGAITWEVDGIGAIALDETGDLVVIYGGAYSGWLYQPAKVYLTIDNEPPTCAIDSPLPGATVMGLVEVNGAAADVDNSLTYVEVVTPGGVMVADPVGTGYENWSIMVDFGLFSGPFTLRARSVDALAKHGPWDEVQVTVVPVTPSPEPTITPILPTGSPTVPVSPSPAATTTPPATGVSLRLLMPAGHFQPGDLFLLDAVIVNHDMLLLDMPVAVLLEVHGTFYCWPAWSVLTDDGGGFDFACRDIPPGVLQAEIVPALIWPEQAGDGYGLLFYGAVLAPDLGSLISNLDFVAWSFSE